MERQHPTPPRQEEKLIKDVTEARAKLDDKRKGMTDFDAHDAVSRLETTGGHHTAAA